jgi:hypothetical protein
MTNQDIVVETEKILLVPLKDRNAAYRGFLFLPSILELHLLFTNLRGIRGIRGIRGTTNIGARL